jgi:hypothetical protein
MSLDEVIELESKSKITNVFPPTRDLVFDYIVNPSSTNLIMMVQNVDLKAEDKNKIVIKECQTKPFSLEKPTPPFSGMTKLTCNFSQNDHSAYLSFRMEEEIDCSKGGF